MNKIIAPDEMAKSVLESIERHTKDLTAEEKREFMQLLPYAFGFDSPMPGYSE